MHNIRMIWDSIKHVVESGEEDRRIDLKETLDLSDRSGRANFVRVASAIVNTTKEMGYIVIGVRDRRYREDSTPSHYVAGFEVVDLDQFQRQMLQAISNYIAPPFEVRYHEISHPQVDKKMGVVEIFPSDKRPHIVIRDSEGIYKGQILVRRGDSVSVASRNEILDMTGDYWRQQLDERVRNLAEIYRDLDREVLDWQYIAEQACRRLYHKLSRKRSERERVIREILSQFGKQEFFEEWFG